MQVLRSGVGRENAGQRGGCSNLPAMGGTLMHMTSNPFLAAFAGFSLAYAVWLNALQEASVREAFRS